MGMSNISRVSFCHPFVFFGCKRLMVCNFGTASRSLPPWVKFKVACYKDFQRFAKPVRLLPASEPKICMPLEPAGKPSYNLDESQYLVKVEIRTSNMYGSSMTDANAGLILCLIDEDGDSVLQRIPLILPSDCIQNETVLFQRGGVDEFTFVSPKVKRVEALWLGVESGQWRVSGATVTMMSMNNHFPDDDRGQEAYLSGLQYEFRPDDDILLGEGTEISLLELRPCNVFEVSGFDSFVLMMKTQSETLAPVHRISRKESMREYSNLKLSLLCYDAALVVIGTLVSNFSGGGTTTLAFLAGGAFGFSYLLFIQISVDNLPTTRTSGGGFLLGGFKSSWPSTALAAGLILLAAKLSLGSHNDTLQMPFTSAEVIAGMSGFFTSKLAVAIAAFAPLPMNSEALDTQIDEEEDSKS